VAAGSRGSLALTRSVWSLTRTHLLVEVAGETIVARRDHMGRRHRLPGAELERTDLAVRVSLDRSPTH